MSPIVMITISCGRRAGRVKLFVIAVGSNRACVVIGCYNFACFRQQMYEVARQSLFKTQGAFGKRQRHVLR